MAFVGLFVCVLVVVIYGLTRGHWTEGLLAGLTLAMATLPEEIPVVLTIFLALGAWRISQKRVLTRRIPAVESLGSATVLCVDKTGTLTLNKMTIARLYTGGGFSGGAQEDEAGAPEAAAGAAAGDAHTSRSALEEAANEDFHRLGGVRHPGERARSLRPHGEGVHASW